MIRNLRTGCALGLALALAPCLATVVLPAHAAVLAAARAALLQLALEVIVALPASHPDSDATTNLLIPFNTLACDNARAAHRDLDPSAQ